MRFFNMSRNNKNVIIDGHRMSCNGIKGSGIAKTVTVKPEPFSRVNLIGSIDVDITISDTPLIQVTADDNLVDLIEVSFFGDSVDIGFKENASFNTNKPMLVKISCPILSRIALSGSGDVTASNLNQENFEASIAGSGDITLNGSAKNIAFSINGSGDIDATHLKAENLEVTIAGSGDVDATATVSAHVRVSGSGDVKVYGNPPKQSSKCNGSGKIKFK